MSVDTQDKEKEAAEKALPKLLMHQRRETMADGRRYIIYYTFENNGEKTNEPISNSPYEV